MKNIVVQIVPFCYGPTSIAIAVGRKLKELVDCNITVICKNPSLDLVSKEQNIFSTIVQQSVMTIECECLSSADLVISICDFDFTESFIKNFPDKKIVFIDPLFWMWETMPSIVTECDLYLALEFPGVPEIISNLSNEKVIMIPQIAEFNGVLPVRINRNNILVNLGGMQSPLGSNFLLALSMCEEIIKVVISSEAFEHVDIRTSNEIAKMLRNKLPNIKSVNISSSSPELFHTELAECKLLLTVPGMSIAYESLQAKIPVLFILPLNYSQHLQIKCYRNIFSKISEISWGDLGDISELPNNLIESEGVRLANVIGENFEKSVETRQKFKKCLKDKLQDWQNINPLKTNHSVDVSGALRVFDLLQIHNLI